MTELGKPAKAASAARNAVAIASRENDKLDLAIYQYSVASSILDLNQTAEAEKLLVEVVTSLRSPAFASLRRDVERTESFENYSTALGEQSAYHSLLNRSQLRHPRHYEHRGHDVHAEQHYSNVLHDGIHDPSHLNAYI